VGVTYKMVRTGARKVEGGNTGDEALKADESLG